MGQPRRALSCDPPDSVVPPKGRFRDIPSPKILTKTKAPKGQNVPKLEPVRHSFYETFDDEDHYGENRGKLSISIYQCDEDKPPDRRNSSVVKFCVVRVDLGVDYEDLEDEITESGRFLKKLHYDVEMVPSGASIDFAVYHEGIKLGSKQASIDFR